MGFIVKGAFWFALVLLALPLLDGSGQKDDTAMAAADAPEIDYIGTFQALSVAIADMQALCDRHPDVCETGGEAFSALMARARDGALVAYRYLDGATAETTVAADTPAPLPALATDTRATGTIGEPSGEMPVISASAKPAPAGDTLPVPSPSPAQ